MEEEIEIHAKEYFGRQEFKSLFSSFKKKIEVLGKVGGSVFVSMKEDERRAIENWFGHEFKGKMISISLRKFEKRLEGSKFEQLTLWELVEIVTNQPIILREEKIAQEEQQRMSYFEGLLQSFPHKNAQFIINKVIGKEKGVYGFLTSYNNNDKDGIEILLKAISNLPAEGEFEKVPVFAERITGNPHYFDKTNKLTQTLEMLLAEHEKRPGRSDIYAEEKAELLTMFGLAKDDLHSFVTCYGLEAYQNNEQVKQWYWANKEKTVQNIPLRAIKKIDRVESSKGNVVFVVENSGVYSSIIDILGDKLVPIVCTHGNFKLSGLLLLDKLVKSDTKIFYSGDIDVSGIKIASYLKKKYKENVHFWRMGIDDYLESISQVEISGETLKRLDYIEEPRFQPVIKLMKEKKVAGYQEPLISKYILDIEQYLDSIDLQSTF